MSIERACVGVPGTNELFKVLDNDIVQNNLTKEMMSESKISKICILQLGLGVIFCWGGGGAGQTYKSCQKNRAYNNQQRNHLWHAKSSLGHYSWAGSEFSLHALSPTRAAQLSPWSWKMSH